MSLFSLVPVSPPEAPAPPRPGEIARGPWWSIRREGDDWLLCYLSADLHGREKRVMLTEAEARSVVGDAGLARYYLPPAG